MDLIGFLEVVTQALKSLSQSGNVAAVGGASIGTMAKVVWEGYYLKK